MLGNAGTNVPENEVVRCRGRDGSGGGRLESPVPSPSASEPQALRQGSPSVVGVVGGSNGHVG